MNILLVTTTDMQAGRGAALERLLETVAASAPAREGALVHLLLAQRAAESETEAIAARFPFVKTMAVADRTPLSRARNILLQSGGGAPLGAADLVAFPDDDAWYPPGLLEGVSGALHGGKTAFFFCRYSSTPTEWREAGFPREAGLRETVFHASSNTIFLRGDLARTLGGFDEDLGAGTPLGSAEDTDYAIRAFRAAPRTEWIDAPLVGHRDATAELRNRYFRGDLYVLARHARGSATGFGLLLRKSAIGGYFLATGRLPPSEVLGAARAAAGAFMRAKR